MNRIRLQVVPNPCEMREETVRFDPHQLTLHGRMASATSMKNWLAKTGKATVYLHHCLFIVFITFFVYVGPHWDTDCGTNGRQQRWRA